MGNPLYAIRLGNGPKEVCYSGSIHANEWITSILLMQFIEDYADAYASNTSLFDYSVRELFATTSIYVIPMLNPDGVNLVTGAFSLENPVYTRVREMASRYPSIPFPSGWKANMRGVDLENLQPVRKAL